MKRAVRWRRLAVVALCAAMTGWIGLLLPAFDGQRVGDPSSTAFRIGVPIGVVGLVAGIVLGSVTIGRDDASPFAKALGGLALGAGALGLLPLVSLLFGG